MKNDMNQQATGKQGKAMGEPITLDEFTEFVQELDEQPTWRSRADKEIDYFDGNQLGSELLKRQQALGIPPAVENVIQVAINALIGMEVKMRKDWRVTPDGDPQGQDVADALNYKLNQAERHSKADEACGDAFKGQASVGIAWVEVSRESDPFKYPYRCTSVHRNEIWWDMLGKNPDTTDWRYLVRKKWMHTRLAAMMFPEHKELINRLDGRWGGEWELSMDGSTGTGLYDSWETQRGWSVEEQEWHDPAKHRALVYEVWYRRWVSINVLTFKRGGRVVELDQDNPAHSVAIAQGLATVKLATVSRVRRAYFLGPHMLHDGPSPYGHRYFGYVPFFYMREDRTGAPYGAIKAMIYPQDSLNSGIAKLRWGMSAVRTERTKGAVAMPDNVFREQVARVDADIVLNADHMSQPGARFDVKRDYQLNEQQYRLLEDSRASIERTSGVSAGFTGRQGTATSGLQEQTQVEQSTQALAGLMAQFSRSRTMVGEILISFITEDMGKEEETVVIEGDAVRPERTVVLNHPEVDPETGIPYLSNDVQRTRLKVALEDVPSSSSFRVQQLNSMSESVKSMPPNMQAAVMPYMVGLMDLPYKREVVEAIRAAAQAETPEAVEARIQEAVQKALKESGNELKLKELELKYAPDKMQAEIDKLVSERVEIGVKSAFGAIQAGQLIAQMPQIAPVADVLLQTSGWRPPTPSGMDPNLPMPDVTVPQGTVNPGDTSPQTPASPASPIQGQNEGINTMRSEV